jgi:hypothetical protein
MATEPPQSDGRQVNGLGYSPHSADVRFYAATTTNIPEPQQKNQANFTLFRAGKLGANGLGNAMYQEASGLSFS